MTQADASMARAAVSPFRIDVPQEDLDNLRRRIADTQWPDKETVADESQGVQLATMQELARYWATDYDWRKVEAQLNALPQFITEIAGLTFTSFTFVRNTRMRCRSSSTTDGPARSSSS
jgi:hypothetical protein